jgi:hypothetical protein
VHVIYNGKHLDQLEADGSRPSDGDERLRVWGLKLVIDGGEENAALDQPRQSCRLPGRIAMGAW